MRTTRVWSTGVAILAAGVLACEGAPPSSQSSGESNRAALAASGIVSVTASSYETGNPPQNAIDQNLSTRWSAQGKGQYIVADLGQLQSVDGMSIAWYSGNTRQNTFAILTSADGTSYTTAFSGTSSGTTASPELYSFPVTSARWVKVVFNGNTFNDWASICELAAHLATSNGIASVTASSYETGNPPQNAIDQNLSTRWSAQGKGQYIVADLGQLRSIDGMSIAWYSGATRQNTFAILTSPDGTSYTTAFSGVSSGTTASPELYSFAVTSARWVKVVFNGNTFNDWASICELAVHLASSVPSAQTVAVAVAPHSASAATGGSVAFSAVVTGTSNTTVQWSVQEGAAGGAVSASGLYTAPATAGTYHVVVRSNADSTKSDTATVSVAAAAPPPPAPAPAPTPATSSCAAEPLRTTGTRYYVCSCDAGAASNCVPGNDSTGTGTASAPWKSIAKAQSQFKAMNGGDTVALCQGGSWASVPDTGYWDNARCSASATCDLREYPTTWGAGIKPKIAMSSGNFVVFRTSGYGGYRVMNLAVSGGNYGVNLWDGVHDVDVCGVTFDSMYIGMYVGGLAAGSYNNKLRQSTITNSTGQGWLGACNNCLIDGNVFRNNGGSSNRNHNIYVGTNCTSAGCYAPTGMTVRNNELTLSAGSTGSCQSTELVVHDPQHNTVIENNYIHEAPGTGSGGCWGIQVNSGGDVPGDFTGLVIRRNRVFTTGGNRSISWAEAPNALVEDNVVVALGPSNDASNGLIVDEPYTSGPAGSVMNTANTVRNNTVYLPSGTHGGDAIAVNREGTGHVVTGNVVVSYSDSSQQAFNCFNNNLSSGSYAFVGNNACWATSGSVGPNAGVSVGNGASPPSPLTSVFVAPGTSPATADFTPASGSPLVGQASAATSCTVAGASNQPCSSRVAVGTPLWSPSDTGVARVRVPTDVGAYER